MIEAIVFDMDGVLFDTERVGIEMAVKSAAEQGVDMPPKVQMELLGSNQAACERRYKELFGDKLNRELFHLRWYDLMLAFNQEAGMPPMKGVPHVLKALKDRGVRLAMATSNKRSVAIAYLETAGMNGLFDEIVTGDQVAGSKPAPDIYLEAARRLHLPPDRCAGVEDSYNGVQAVRAAGMTCVMVPDLIPFGEKHAPFVDVTLKSLEELVPWLEGLKA